MNSNIYMHDAEESGRIHRYPSQVATPSRGIGAACVCALIGIAGGALLYLLITDMPKGWQ